SGKLARTERDANSDGVVDQWWEYPTPDCPVIHTDTTGDGRPDPGASVDYCKETGYLPPVLTSSQPAQRTFDRPGSLPTQVEEKSEAPAQPGGSTKKAGAP
ncbi:MAG TPA: hypothetical protein VGJ84_11545, partial [Polyangiaceae bacterium]